jgi:hypothetical protein
MVNDCDILNSKFYENRYVQENRTEEICTYMRCWESPGDLPLVIEIVVSFRSFRCAPLAKRHKISITRGRSPGLSQERNKTGITCRAGTAFLTFETDQFLFLAM